MHQAVFQQPEHIKYLNNLISKKRPRKWKYPECEVFLRLRPQRFALFAFCFNFECKPKYKTKQNVGVLSAKDTKPRH